MITRLRTLVKNMIRMEGQGKRLPLTGPSNNAIMAGCGLISHRARINEVEVPTTRDEILQKLKQSRETIRGFGVVRLGVFGSYGRGEATPGSDMDFLVEFHEPTLQKYVGLQDFLERLFGCSVDLVLADVLKPRLKPIILRETVYAQGLPEVTSKDMPLVEDQVI